MFLVYVVLVWRALLIWVFKKHTFTCLVAYSLPRVLCVCHTLCFLFTLGHVMHRLTGPSLCEWGCCFFSLSFFLLCCCSLLVFVLYLFCFVPNETMSPGWPWASHFLYIACLVTVEWGSCILCGDYIMVC